MNEQRQQVVKEALTWLGTPWRHGACVKGAGVDCAHLLIACYQGIFGKIDIETYNQDWAMHRSEEKFLSYIERYGKKVERKGLPGDVALFKYGRCLSHSAIVIDWPTILHAHLFARCVLMDDIERNTQLSWRFAGLWSPWSD
jgi:cell wall-associated NlpC family hydrolase